MQTQCVQQNITAEQWMTLQQQQMKIGQSQWQTQVDNAQAIAILAHKEAMAEKLRGPVQTLAGLLLVVMALLYFGLKLLASRERTRMAEIAVKAEELRLEIKLAEVERDTAALENKNDEE